MREYGYFPGCSAHKGTGIAFGVSTRAVAETLGMNLIELEDWNCCGSTPYTSTNELEAICIAARNLALAEKTGLDLVTPCSDCYIILKQANTELKAYPDLKKKVDACLAAGNMEYQGKIQVRHLFEVIYSDIGLEFIKSKVVNPLKGLKVAAYYGCQMIRPECSYDDIHNPKSLDRFMAALGAEPVSFPMKDRCCGGSMIIPELDLALGLVYKLLESAASNGAQCITTVCPLCQTNLDAYQGLVNRKFRTRFSIPALFFTQLMGIAFGIDPGALALDRSIVPADRLLSGFIKVPAA